MSPQRQSATPVDRTPTDVVDGALGRIEVGLEHDDPRFVRRMRRLRRADAVHAVTVTVLLAAAAVLLVTGLATQTRWLWAGGVAFVAAFGVDHRYQRQLAGAAKR